MDKTIALMAALASKRNINELDRQLRARFGEHIYDDYAGKMAGKYRAYNVIAAAFDYGLDEWDIAEMSGAEMCCD